MAQTLAALLFLVSTSALGAALPERAAAIAAEIGAPAPASAVAAAAPAAPAASAPVAAAAPAVTAKAITIRVLLAGSDKLSCVGGRFDARVSVHGAARVYVEDGYDDVPVQAEIALTGACANGSGTVAGSATIEAADGVYLYKDGQGRQIGFLSVRGPLVVSQKASGSSVVIGQFVDLAGTLETPCVGHWKCGVIPDPDTR